jgi:hypothetical protein
MPGGLCAFDIDNTITCGRDNAKDLIGWCRDHDIPVAIVTARPRPVPPRDWEALGFTMDDLRHRFRYNPRSPYQDGFAHGGTKVRALEQLMHQENVHTGRDCVVLLDDMAYNTDAAREAGFTAIRVGDGDGGCGIAQDHAARVREKLRSCIGRG